MLERKNVRSGLLLMLSVLVVFMTLLTVRPQVTYACSCAVPSSPVEAMEKSTAVFEGTVTSMEKSSKLVQSSGDPVYVTFLTGAHWKGEVGEQITVSTAQSSASCGFEFTEGERYLVYARGGAEGANGTGGADGGAGGTEGTKGADGKAKLTVSLCSRTTLYSNAQEDLNELGAGMSVGSPTEPPGIAGDNRTAAPADDHGADSDNNPTTEPETASAPWLLYAGAGAGIIVLGAAALILLRRRSNGSRR
ncbi:hypothetical protein [Paenibacillus piscarius]|uniref:hypothetical protein n=1 Tax=Paenibacillus piscarius TaxID=1089681 RepID=UPI001EE8C327|nr:hypothetical protein [Paenibacillus piscarius]